MHGGPAAAVAAGVGLVPEDRKRRDWRSSARCRTTCSWPACAGCFRTAGIGPARAARVAAELTERLRVATPSLARLAKFLSGGNQQKVVIGKWLNAGSQFFIFDEPTRGIDVGAKAEIYHLMEKLVAEGAAVLMISSELPEIVSVCDRAYVMRDKTIVGELGGRALTRGKHPQLAMHS